MHTFELLLVLVAASVGLAYIAQRTRLPSAVALVLGGIALAFVTGIGMVELNPDLALALFLPPLLQASAYRTDWPAFRSNLRPILLLAVGAVFLHGSNGRDRRALAGDRPALGSRVHARRDRCASRCRRYRRRAQAGQAAQADRDVLEGESLINDASSLVLYRFAVSAMLAGTFSFGSGLLQFFGAAIGGGVAGWIVGRVAMWIFVLLEDTLLDITVSFLASFVAYFLAEQFHVSGVLASVVCGFVLGRH